MAEPHEQQEAFASQLENNLDKRIKELEKTDLKRAGQLARLKRQLLEEIKSGGDNPETKEKESYLDDLKITQEELLTIFMSNELERELIKNEIYDFKDFLRVLGLDMEFKTIEPLEKGANMFELHGHNVELKLKLDTGKNELKQIRKVVRQINMRKDLGKYINKNTKFRLITHNRIEFKIEKGGKEKSYVSTPDAVLLVVEDPRKGIEESYRSERRNYEYAKRSLIEGLKEAKYFKGHIKADISRTVQLAEIGHLKRKLPPKFRALADNLFRGYKALHRIKRKEEKARLLLNEKTGTYVKEKITGIEVVRHFEHEEKDRTGRITSTIYGKDISRFKHPTKTNPIEVFEIEYLDGRKESKEENKKTGESKTIKYRADGTIQEIVEINRKGDHYTKTTEFNKEGHPKSSEKISYHPRKREYEIYVDEKGPIGLITDEEEKSPELKSNAERSNEAYLNMLAKRLDTPEKLALFFNVLLQYRHDDPTLETRDYKTPNLGGNKDYWQLATETIRRIEKGKMLGDCDDYAFLAQEILRRQLQYANPSKSKQPEVIYISGNAHATCIWVEKRKDGRYDFYSIGTFGFDRNGNKLGGKENPEKAKGYANLTDGVNSLMKKYEEKGLGISEGFTFRVFETVKSLRIPGKGRQRELDMPIEGLIDPLIRTEVIIAKLASLGMELREDSKIMFNIAREIYEALAEAYPKQPFYLIKLGHLYELVGDKKKAIDYLKRGTDMQIELGAEMMFQGKYHGKLVENLHKLYSLQGDGTSRIQLLKNAVSVDGPEIFAYHHLGEHYKWTMKKYGLNHLYNHDAEIRFNRLCDKAIKSVYMDVRSWGYKEKLDLYFKCGESPLEFVKIYKKGHENIGISQYSMIALKFMRKSGDLRVAEDLILNYGTYKKISLNVYLEYANRAPLNKAKKALKIGIYASHSNRDMQEKLREKLKELENPSDK